MHPFHSDNVKTDLHVMAANYERYNEILWLILAYSDSFHRIHRRQMCVISLYTSWTLKLQEEFALCGSHFSFALVLIHSWDLKTHQWHKTALVVVTSCGNKWHFVPYACGLWCFYSAFFTFLKICQFFCFILLCAKIQLQFHWRKLVTQFITTQEWANNEKILIRGRITSH